MAPDQPKLLFTSEDVSSVIGIWLGPSSRWLDTDRHARISQALRPAMAYLIDHGLQIPPDQMQKALEALKEVDQPAYEAAASEVRKIDPQFVEKGRSPSKPVE